MRPVRLVATAIAYALVALFLVIGSLSLSFAEGRRNAPSPSGSESTRLTTETGLPGAMPAGTGASSSSTAQNSSATISVPTSTFFYPTVGEAARASPTFSGPCGPAIGWVRTYIVQRGDTLYRIASLHGISVELLQKANCRTGTFIYAGERLWVPFELPAPTALTIIPTFDTPTEPPTETASPTPTATATLDPDP
jgi:LysM repeat protein